MLLASPSPRQIQPPAGGPETQSSRRQRRERLHRSAVLGLASLTSDDCPSIQAGDTNVQGSVVFFIYPLPWTFCVFPLHIGLSANMAQPLRRLISGPKARFVQDGVDLDLAYVTDRLIIMAFPAAGVATMWRNDRRVVRNFLDERHDDKWRVYNFCPRGENEYDDEEFYGRGASESASGGRCRSGCFPHSTNIAPSVSCSQSRGTPSPITIHRHCP